MENGTPSRPSAFIRYNQKDETSVAAPMSTPIPPKGVPLALPGTGIQNPLPPPPMFYPPEILRQLFQPYMNGQTIPPEFFSIPAAVAAAAVSPVSVASVQPTTSAASPMMIPSLPTNTQTPRTFSKGAQHHLRLREDNNDSGNESSTLSPVSDFSLSRSPSTSSRSNSLSNCFAMTSILKPAAIINKPTLQVVPTSSAPPATPVAKPTVPHPVSSQPSTSQMQPPQPQMVHFPMYPQTPRAQMHPQFMGMSPLTPHGMGMVHPHFMPQMAMPMPMQFDPLMSGPMRETCQICNDNASGYHYGVMSCEGCKGFFRRTVQKGIAYKCHRDSGCKMDRVNRNRCQACRFKKCLEMGMTRESVRQDRGRKRKNDDETKAQLEDLKMTVEQNEKLVAAFKSYFPENAKMQTLQDVSMRTRLFADALQPFSTVSKQQMEEIAQKSVRGVSLLRSAKTSDDCTPVIGDQSDLSARIRAGIEIATYEDVAVLTAVYMASFTDDLDLQDQLSKCLRAQLKTRMPNEEHLYLALMAKLRFLN